MQINDIRALAKCSSVELVEHINIQLGAPIKDLVNIFMLCLFFTIRYSKNNTNITKDMLPELGVSLFVDVFTKNKISLNELNTFVRGEIWATFESAILQRVELDKPYAWQMDNDNYSDESETERLALLELARSKMIELIPLRLVPIVRYYIDTGILSISLLSDVDKFLVLFFLNKLGARMEANVDLLAEIIPKDSRGKALFLSALCSNNEELFVLLNLFGDLNKLFILSEIFGGKEIRIPSREELVNTIEDLSKSSSKFQEGEPVSTEFLSAFTNLDPKSVAVNITLIDHLRETLDLENSHYLRGLARLSNSPDSKVILKALTGEIGNTAGILARLSKLSTSN